MSRTSRPDIPDLTPDALRALLAVGAPQPPPLVVTNEPTRRRIVFEAELGASETRSRAIRSKTRGTDARTVLARLDSDDTGADGRRR